jgi:DUF1365 family protein
VSAASLYVGRTAHRRFTPRPHRFSYAVFQILLDVDQLHEATEGLRTFRIGRFGLFSFAERDHGARDGSPLRAWVEAQLRAADVVASARRIQLLCFPRILGFVFNPISIFFVHDEDERLEAVIYEVNNTFGQTHAYVVPASGRRRERQAADKVFFVSPFYRVEGRYLFDLTVPADDFRLSIVKETDGAADFTASLIARRQALTDIVLLKLFFAMPLMTLGVVAAIHFEAFRLWLKRAPFNPNPPRIRAGMSAGKASGSVAG